jgi:hypothetical protein
MIERIPGWSWAVRQRGIYLFPPEGQEAGGVFYVERQRPLRRMRDIVAALPTPRRPLEISRVERTTTWEGEYGAIATLVAADGSVGRTVGAVFGDDFYSLVVGIPGRPDQYARFDEVVRRLVHDDSHMLGVRRRRFVYDPPTGWHGLLAPPFHAHWYPWDYPRNPSNLAVGPAVPIPSGDTAFARSVLGSMVANISGGTMVDPGAMTPMTSRSGVSGGSWWFSPTHRPGVVLTYDIVLFEDRRYLYSLLLQSPTARRDENLGAMKQVIESLEPIPSGSSVAQTAGGDVLGVWMEE